MMAPASLTSADLRPPPAMAGMRIGLLGGSFNPPHEAHRMISLRALKRLHLHQVWWIVTPGNPLKDHAELLPLAERMRLCRMLARDARIKVTGFEAGLNSAYTAASLSFLRRRFPKTKVVWLMVAYNLASVHRWHRWQEIFESMPIAVEDRPEWRYLAMSSPAATRFAHCRIPEADAGALLDMKPPAWCYLSGPLSKLSSTALRATSLRRS